MYGEDAGTIVKIQLDHLICFTRQVAQNFQLPCVVGHVETKEQDRRSLGAAPAGLSEVVIRLVFQGVDCQGT